MVGIDELANMLFNRKRAESDLVSTDATTHTYIGIATSDSTNGLVQVSLGGYETLAEDTGQTEFAGGIMVPCGPNVKKGDSVVVSAIGGGVMKAPMVVSASGSGDRQQEQIGTATSSASAARTTANAANSTANAASATANSAANTASSAASTANNAATAAAAAQTAANAAVTTANATAQHFWHDNNGVHVSSVAGSADGTMNTLWNSLGMLFRKGANNLLSLVTGDSPGVHIYDGAGNAAANIVASFTSTLIELGKNSTNSVIRLCGGAGKITATSTDIYMSGANRLAWIGLWERATASHVTIGAAKGGKTASFSLLANASSKTAEVSAGTFKATLDGSEGLLRPIGIYVRSITTQANSYTNTTVNIASSDSSAGDITVTDTDYVVLLATEGAPAGFTRISHTVLSKYVNSFVIHSYNDYSQAITQTVVAIVLHK